MENKMMLARVQGLPAPDLVRPGKITDEIGSDSFYSARAVVRLLGERPGGKDNSHGCLEGDRGREMTTGSHDKRHIKVIRERIDYLTDKIANCSEKAKTHHRRERAALQWALEQIGVGESK